MRLSALVTLALAAPLALAADAAHWAKKAAASKDGVISLANAREYDDILSGDREFGVTVVLTAMPAQFKCAPCHEFDPTYRTVARSWRRVPADQRDKHFFALLDFEHGQQVYQRYQLTTAPSVWYHPPNAGPRKAANPREINFDLNKNGLGIPQLHQWARTTTPVPFDIYRPVNPIPIIMTAATLALGLYVSWQMRAILIPIATSRLVWGVFTTCLCVLFTSGYMWNKIKNAPYVQAGPGGRISWVAAGYSNQLGLESQVVGGLYGVLSLTVIVLSVFIPAQSSPAKQRVGTILWVALMIVLFSLLVRLFKMKNPGYPFTLLF